MYRQKVDAELLTLPLWRKTLPTRGQCLQTVLFGLEPPGVQWEHCYPERAPHCPTALRGPYSFTAKFDSFARLHSILGSLQDLAEFSLTFISSNICSLWYRVQRVLAKAWHCTPTTYRTIPPPSKCPQAVPLSPTHIHSPGHLQSVLGFYGFCYFSEQR